MMLMIRSPLSARLDRRKRPGHDARIVAVSVLAVGLARRVPLILGVGVPAHPAERQRFYVVGAGRSDVHLLAVAVGVEQDRAPLAGRQNRQRAFVERQRD